MTLPSADRRAILASLLVIGIAGSALGAMTWAHYADSDASQANTIQADTMNLELDGSSSLSGSFAVTNGQPDSSATHNFTLTNAGAVSADHVEISFSFGENDPAASEPSDGDLGVELNATETASLVEVTTLEYQNESGDVLYDAMADMNDTNGNGVLDLQDARDQDGRLDDLAAPQANGGNETYLVVAVEIANDDDGSFVREGNTAGSLTGYDEDVMADGVDVTITFTLNQVASQ